LNQARNKPFHQRRGLEHHVLEPAADAFYAGLDTNQFATIFKTMLKKKEKRNKKEIVSPRTNGQAATSVVPPCLFLQREAKVAHPNLYGPSFLNHVHIRSFRSSSPGLPAVELMRSRDQGPILGDSIC
jgi:hypothetical protein